MVGVEGSLEDALDELTVTTTSTRYALSLSDHLQDSSRRN
jgi:hypothetical protein